MANGNVAIVRDFYATWNPDHLDPDVDWRLSGSFPNGGAYRGVSAVFEDWWPRHAATFSEWKADAQDFLDAGTAVIVLGRYKGRAAASGRAFDVPFVHVWWMSDGRIAAFDQHCDTYAIREALGSAARQDAAAAA